MKPFTLAQTITIAVAVAYIGCGGTPSPTRTSSTPERREPSDMSSDRFEQVKRTFEKQGARVERDFQSMGANTVRIYLPASVAANITPQQAKTMASMARDKLSQMAIVYIKGPGGDTIAKSWKIDP